MKGIMSQLGLFLSDNISRSFEENESRNPQRRLRNKVETLLNRGEILPHLCEVHQDGGEAKIKFNFCLTSMLQN